MALFFTILLLAALIYVLYIAFHVVKGMIYRHFSTPEAMQARALRMINEARLKHEKNKPV